MRCFIGYRIILRLRMEIFAQKLSLLEAVEVMRHFYEPGGELAAIADSDTDDFYEYEDYA